MSPALKQQVGNDHTFGAWRLIVTASDGAISNAFDIGAPVPEPATLGRLDLGLAGLGLAHRRKI